MSVILKAVPGFVQFSSFTLQSCVTCASGAVIAVASREKVSLLVNGSLMHCGIVQ